MLEDYAKNNGYTNTVHFTGNVNRLIDTKGMNRILGKPLKIRDSGTLVVAGILCLLSGLCQGNMRAADVNSHSGHKSDPSVAVLTPPLVQFDPLIERDTNS